MAAAFGVLAGAMLAYPAQAAAAAWEALGLWARAVAPALGPFMVCMLMITSRVGGGVGLRTLLGWLSGSPGGARLMREAGLTGRAAMRAAAMTGTMSPMFFLGAVAQWMGSPRLGWIIFLCHVAGAAAIGLCVKHPEEKPNLSPSPMPLGTALRESALALLTVALCMMLGSVAAQLTACAFPALPPALRAALQCALEVTAGVKAIVNLQTHFTAPLICGACSFGGLSLLLQNGAFWQESGVSLGQLALLRLLHGLLSAALCQAAASLFS